MSDVRASVFEAEDGTRWVMHVTPSTEGEPCRMVLAELLGPELVQGRRDFTLIGSVDAGVVA